jgi:ParB family chromosome partitioning protein
MAKRPVLGRGLAALLGETTADTSTMDEHSNREDCASVIERVVSGQAPGQESHGVVDLPVGSIRRNPRQPRRAMEAEALDQLASSIEAVGIVQPVIVRPIEGGYELIAGERRWRAAQKAGFTVVPAIIRQASDVESLELALVENVVRQELNPVDEAFALKVLLEDLGVTQDNLAARVGKSRSAIANKIRLLDLPGPVQDALADGTITEGHGRALLGLPSQGQQVQLARRIVEKGMSVRQVEDEVRRLASSSPTAPSRRSLDMDVEALDELQQALFSSLGIKPRIKARGTGGVIELPFRDVAELVRLKERLLS